jgi:hypothetical protein
MSNGEISAFCNVFLCVSNKILCCIVWQVRTTRLIYTVKSVQTLYVIVVDVLDKFRPLKVRGLVYTIRVRIWEDSATKPAS